MNNNNIGVKPLAIVADDEETGRLLLADAVEQVGLVAMAYDNGTEALDVALVHGASIVLLDVDMPGMDGFTVCRRLRADPRFSSVPIVMVTGHEDAQAIERAFEAGATDFIAKPVNWSLLPRRLEYILRNAASAERIERLAYYDSLTELPNRQRCLDTATRQFRIAEELDQSVAVMYLDLNNFKRVNDTFGHSIGDAVLKTVAAKLSKVVKDFTTELAAEVSGAGVHISTSRFGGDEFVMLVRAAHAQELAVRLAERCQVSFEESITYDELEFFSAPSIGLALYPTHGTDISTVFKHADTAMYQAKNAGTASIVLYSPEMSGRLRDWLNLEARLRRAIRADRLKLVYQPKFSLDDMSLVGVEALLRWHDDEFGDVSPARFIEIAEESGLIFEVTGWVIRAACRQLKRWLDAGLETPVAINVSGKELLHGDISSIVQAETAAAGVPASLIEIEITESVLVKDSQAVNSAFARLRALGCRVALDDFGTGFSSLAYIARFPPDRIKIDQAFVRNLERSASDAAVATTILTLGASLGITVTAEGIERASQLDWLRTRGCDEVQGFLLSRPIAPEALEERFLRTRRLLAEVPAPLALAS